MNVFVIFFFILKILMSLIDLKISLTISKLKTNVYFIDLIILLIYYFLPVNILILFIDKFDLRLFLLEIIIFTKYINK
jgi:hypothetical protein